MTANISLRPARPGDAAAIARVHVDTWRAAYAGLVPEAYLVEMTESGQARQWRTTIQGAVAPETVLVAESGDIPGGRIVGFGSCGHARGRPGAGEVFTLYVTPDWQGRGLGQRLLGALFTRLCGGGLDEAVIWVLRDNPSRFFYEAMGGRRVAERQQTFAGAALTEAAYAWPDLVTWLAERNREGPII